MLAGGGSSNGGAQTTTQDDTLRIGMVLYPSLGGSSTVAVELGRHLARRGHVVHLVSTGVPFALSRLHDAEAGRLVHHRVEVPSYPLFAHAPYDLALATKLAEVATAERLDILHVHYAVPHAAAAVLARAMMAAPRPAVVATLHGTDVTLTGRDPALRPAVAFSLNRSQRVTAVSSYLAEAARAIFGLDRIEVIPDFVDLRPVSTPARERTRAALAAPGEAVIAHASNFRPVKNIPDVVAVFERVARTTPAVLVLVGDGPEAGAALARLADAGLAGRVRFLGVQSDPLPVLAAADVLLLPTSGEGFGLTALEAMAVGVPVVGTMAGGLPEVVEHGQSGYLLDVHAVDAMAEAVLATLEPTRHAVMAAAARRRAARFSAARVVPRYEALYRQARSD
jgi:N-acetyl-alpha-D-glucosaminyl L-malate synthase BshA